MINDRVSTTMGEGPRSGTPSFITTADRTGRQPHPCPELHHQRGSFSQRGIRCPVLQMDPRQKPRLIEIIQNLRDRIREARANGWLGEVEGLQVSFDAAMAKLKSLKNIPTDGRPQLVDLGMPFFIDDASPIQSNEGEPRPQS
ncbi:hypothetical protein OG890_20750 [Streptomyces anulatus]|uniref:hypothetical protein n=1 Tax=Streptomyces anulatus TaxID=1892 RepID=UPI00225932B8|nr:hypothetical protein [Streptomyces anulatus]MCX4486354.1 hypothetical protein [Streptomyces anulatus]WSU78479.1 hypothetical protein OG499_38620 [Streptomyces anulatus]